MRVPLIDLVQTRKIIHPSRLMGAASDEKGTLRFKLKGYPWWMDHDNPDERRIDFVFTEISRGSVSEKHLLYPEWDDEILEGLHIQSLAEVDWAQPHSAEIYGNGPVPNPLGVYAVLHDYLASKGSFYSPGDFLNGCDSTISAFSEISTSRSYLLARAPEAILQLLADELDRQSVPYNVLRYQVRSPETRIWFQLEDTYLVCKEAFAEWQD